MSRMDVYFGVGGELLTPLDEMLDGDIKLSLELDLDLKDPINNGIAAHADDWGGWGSLRASPTLTDLFGERENCIMVSPESVMPFIKREVHSSPYMWRLMKAQSFCVSSEIVVFV